MAIQLVVPDKLIDDQETAVLLRRDAKAAVEKLAEAGEAGLTTIRFFVESYYDHQRYRTEASNRVRAAVEAGAPADLMNWLKGRWANTEGGIAYMLKQYVEIEKTGMGQWATSHVGIGPIIAAGLLAYIDMNKAKHVSSVWRFFGLDPTLKWNKGERRPWNARAKVLAWKIGHSFMMFHNKPNCEYGRIYAERKELEDQRNKQGAFAETAKRTLEQRNIKEKKTREFYESGKLPPGRIEQRAERYATKLFLSAWWREAYRKKFGTDPEDPWVVAKSGGLHTRVIG